MLNVIEDKVGIQDAHNLIESVFEKLNAEKIPVKVVYRPGSVKCKVSYSKKYDMWFYFGGTTKGRGKNKRERYWNVFGIGKPKENSRVRILVEINPPVKGIYRRVAGAFAKGSNDNIFLLHRGIIGGGRKGIGPKLFFKRYVGEKAFVQDGGRMSSKALVIIGRITSSEFPEKVKEFVYEVNRIKNK